MGNDLEGVAAINIVMDGKRLSSRLMLFVVKSVGARSLYEVQCTRQGGAERSTSSSVAIYGAQSRGQGRALRFLWPRDQGRRDGHLCDGEGERQLRSGSGVLWFCMQRRLSRQRPRVYTIDDNADLANTYRTSVKDFMPRGRQRSHGHRRVDTHVQTCRRRCLVVVSACTMLRGGEGAY